MNQSPEQPKEQPKKSTEPTRLGELFDDVRDEIKHNAMFNNTVARSIIEHQTAMKEQGDPQASPETLAAAEEQLRQTQATLDHLEKSQQPPEDDH